MIGDNRVEKKKKIPKIRIIFILVFVIIVLCLYYLFTEFHIEKIEISGNDHYTEEEIKNIVISNQYVDNTLLLWMKNKISPIRNIPFIDTIDISYIDKNTINIEIYEKALAGCIAYMGEYIYFDQEGYVLESSPEKFEDVPRVLGLKFDGFVLHEKLPIDNEKNFKLILDITQMIKKYELNIDKIRFNVSGELVLYKDKITILMGQDINMEEKLAVLPNILKEAEGLAGTLHMEDYSKTNTMAPFDDAKAQKTTKKGVKK